MGIKRRMIWLGMGMLLCWLCAGCSQKAGVIPKELQVPIQRQETESLQETEEPQAEVVEEIVEMVETVPEVSVVPEESIIVEEAAVPEKSIVVKGEAVSEKSVVVEEAAVPEESIVVEEATVLEESIVVEEPAVLEDTIATEEVVMSGESAPAKEFEVTEQQITEVSAVIEQPVVSKKPEVIENPVEIQEPIGKQVSDITQSPTIAQTTGIHTHNAVTQAQEATCLTAGVIRECCETCQAVLSQEVLSALGHDFTKSVWELPTCQKGGYYNNICNRCGQVECVTQEPLDHEVEDILIQEGNCMEDTVIQHVCKECGVQVRSETRYTPYDVHLWRTEVIDGSEITYCERCGIAK